MDPSAATSTRDAHAHLPSFFPDARSLGEPPSREEVLLRRLFPMVPPPLRRKRYAAMIAQMAAPPPALQPIRTTPMAQDLHTTRQLWPQSPPCYPYASPVASPNRAGHASQIGAAAGSPFGIGAAYSPAQSCTPQHQPGGPSSSAQKPLNASASQYLPKPAAAPLTVSQSYQPYAILPSPAPESLLQRRARAMQAAQAHAMPPRARRPRTLEETRSALLGGAPMELQLVMPPGSAAHVVHLLRLKDVDDYERIRHSVLSGVTRRAHAFIDNKDGHEVLVALLRACAGRPAEVCAIVQAAAAPSAKGRHSLVRPTMHGYWERSVEELLTAAAPYPDMGGMLVDRLLSEGLLEHERGDQLLHLCFAKTSHQDAVILLQCTLDKVDTMIDSSSGTKCLVDCYDKATGQQLQAFNDFLLARAPEIAMGKFSNYFMQHVLEHADGETRRLLVEQLMADVVQLSLHPTGSYVVQACYEKAGLLATVLAAFLRVDNACLVQLVKGVCANYVVHKLLDTAIETFPRETMALARRIAGLPQEVTNSKYGKNVMKVVRRLLTRHGRMYA